MKPLPNSVSDQELIGFIDGWATLFERQTELLVTDDDGYSHCFGVATITVG